MPDLDAQQSFDVEAITATLTCGPISPAQARHGGPCGAGDACLCPVVDGRETMDAGLLQFLLDTRPVKTAAPQHDGATRGFFATPAPRDLPWVGVRRRVRSGGPCSSPRTA